MAYLEFVAKKFDKKSPDFLSLKGSNSSKKSVTAKVGGERTHSGVSEYLKASYQRAMKPMTNTASCWGRRSSKRLSGANHL
ncbi:hypothetical protein O9992_00765 [Vibrio lentus]|nr:hypothetical protein [Vibrio lentus]